MKAVITGATKGIGKAIAKQLASEEAYDLLLIARTESELKILEKELSNKYSIQIGSLSLDLSDALLSKKLEMHKSFFNGSTVLVNNLGVYSTQVADDIDLGKLQQQIQVNLFGAITLTQFLLHELRKNKGAHIVNIGSKMSIEAAEWATDYSISKHALKAWNDGLRSKLRKENIKVSAIYPGAVNTPSWDGIDAPREEMIQASDIALTLSTILKMSSNSLLEEVHIEPLNFMA